MHFSSFSYLDKNRAPFKFGASTRSGVKSDRIKIIQTVGMMIINLLGFC
ncbi:hypothetical protein NVIRPANT_00089 [Pantoea sp. Nvir]|nr:hypothetical protein NVIRPANT_00089 [Pantoea sp. Nvir]